MSKANREASRAARAAEALRAQQRRERNRRLAIVGGIAAVLAVVVVVFAVVQSQRDTTGESVDAGGTPSGVVDDYGVVVGADDAPTTITIYEDFQCPACAQFEATTGDALATAVDDGRVKVDYRMVSFLDRASTTDYSSRALNAAMVVLDTAGVEAFRAFHEALFAQQPEEGTAGLSDDELIDLAVEAGADETAIRGPIEDRAFEQWVRNTADEMSRAGVNGTPTVLVDGERTDEPVEAVLSATQ